MAIIRLGTERTWVAGDSGAYVFVGADGELHIGDEDSKDETEMVALSPEDMTEVVCQLLDRADYGDVDRARDALVEWQAGLD